MRKMLFLVVISLVLSGAASAGVSPCPILTNIGALISSFGVDTGNQCSSEDKLFSNFAYAPKGSDPIAGLVNASLRSQTVGDTDVHGWAFNAPNAWTSGFTLSYTIAVAAGNPLVFMFQSKDQMYTVPSGNTSTVFDYQTGVTPSPLTLTGGTESQYSDIYHLTSIDTAVNATVNGTANMNSLEQSWFERNASAVPEPMTFVLIGTGLLGLGLLRRRTRKS